MSLSITFTDPSSIPGGLLWLKAAAHSLNDDDPVSTGVDSFGLGDVTQTLTKRPLFKTNIVNGKPVFRFDGSNDLLVGAVARFTGHEGTVFAVASTTSIAASERDLFSTADEASSGSYVMCSRNGAKMRMQQSDVGDSNPDDHVEGPANLAINTFYLMEWVSDGGEQGSGVWRMYLNGTLQTLTLTGHANSGDWFSDTTARDNIAIGALKFNSTEGRFWAGDLAELIVYDHALPDEYRNLIGGYVQTEYGLTIAGATFPSTGVVRSRIFGKFIRSSS